MQKPNPCYLRPRWFRNPNVWGIGIWVIGPLTVAFIFLEDPAVYELIGFVTVVLAVAVPLSLGFGAERVVAVRELARKFLILKTRAFVVAFTRLLRF